VSVITNAHNIAAQESSQWRSLQTAKGRRLYVIIVQVNLRVSMFIGLLIIHNERVTSIKSGKLGSKPNSWCIHLEYKSTLRKRSRNPLFWSTF